MFQRRHRHTALKRTREALWPSMGWKRMLRYYKLRVGRLPGTPHDVALGFAAGVGIAFTPLVGFHFALTCVATYFARASILAGVIGSMVGNPWTYPFIWVGTYKLGRFMMGLHSEHSLPQKFSVEVLFEHPFQYFWPMMAGSIPCAVVAGALSYVLIHRLVAGYKTGRKKRRHK